MTNTSLMPREEWNNLPAYVVFMINGVFIGAGNLIIALSIARYSALRTNKSYLIILGLAAADSMLLMAALVAGVYRSLLLYRGVHHHLLTSWQCMTTVHNLLFSFASHLSTLMLVCVSFDRLCCVLWPLAYLGWSTTYAKLMLFGSYASTISLGAYGIANTYPTRNQPPTVEARCLTPQALSGSKNLGGLYMFYYSSGSQIFALLSIALYIVVAVVYKKKTAQVAPEQQQYELAQQRKITRSLGISCICTLLFQVIPFSLAQISAKLGIPGAWVVAFFALSQLNPACNIVIYAVRHCEIRQAIYGLFTGKQKPANLKLWAQNQPPSQAWASAQQSNRAV